MNEKSSDLQSIDVYLALGDSMSIDFYPSEDARKNGKVTDREDIGSASLLFQNDSSLFPEFDGMDLQTLLSGVRFVNQAIDGATTHDLLREDFSKVVGNRAVVTLTLGGNDLLNALRQHLKRDQAALLSELTNVQKRYEDVLRTIKKQLPDCVLVLTTVFDPTDGTGIMPSATSLYEMTMPIELLDAFNNFVKTCAQSHSALIADVHSHFRGHGAECGSADQFWYWKPSPIEPSCKGASEIRRVWLDTLNLVPSCK